MASSRTTTLALLVLALFCALASCQQQPAVRQAAAAVVTGRRALGLMQSGNNTLTANNSVLLLIDHQTGLFQLVKDWGVNDFKNNVLALAATAKHFKVPTILTTSFDKGPNGPTMPELLEMFPNAPYIQRPGQINAWDNADFVKAVKATGRKKLIMAGIVTDVCIAFPALSALAEGFEVYVVVDASGTFNEAVRQAALDRMVAAGVVPINWFAVACELQNDWRQDGEGMATLLANYLPDYSSLISSYNTAMNASKGA